MKVTKKWMLLFVILQIQQFVLAQVEIFEGDKVSNQIQENLDIYLVIGQSNMAGRAAIRTVDTLGIEKTHLFTGNELNPWVAANNPLNRYSSVRKKIGMQRMGPSHAFAQSMAAENKNQEIGLIVNAKGGTKIVQWLPGTTLYQEAIKQANKALKYGKLKGIIWHQGESDCDSIRVGIYLGRLEIIINSLREEFEDPTIPFIAGQVYENKSSHAFNEMILQLPNFIRNTGIVISAGTNTKDGVHFDSESAILMGNRYAIEMKKIQK
jgi:hypothetical protein